MSNNMNFEKQMALAPISFRLLVPWRVDGNDEKRSQRQHQGLTEVIEQ
jgi:hypothetical protein